MFNRVVGSSLEFVHAAWNGTRHCTAADLPQIDKLSYLCSIAREAVFFMAPLNGKDDVSITFRHPPNYFRRDLLWPSSLDSQILPTAALVEMSLRRCGFSDIDRPKENVFIAMRNGRGASIYTPPQDLPRILTGDRPTLVEERFLGEFNIIACNGRFNGLGQDEGAFYEVKARGRQYRRCIDASTIDALKARLREEFACPQ